MSGERVGIEHDALEHSTTLSCHAVNKLVGASVTRCVSSRAISLNTSGGAQYDVHARVAVHHFAELAHLSHAR